MIVLATRVVTPRNVPSAGIPIHFCTNSRVNRLYTQKVYTERVRDHSCFSSGECVRFQAKEVEPTLPNEGLSSPTLTGPNEGLYAEELANRFTL